MFGAGQPNFCDSCKEKAENLKLSKFSAIIDDGLNQFSQKNYNYTKHETIIKITIH